MVEYEEEFERIKAIDDAFDPEVLRSPGEVSFSTVEKQSTIRSSSRVSDLIIDDEDSRSSSIPSQAASSDSLSARKRVRPASASSSVLSDLVEEASSEKSWMLLKNIWLKRNDLYGFIY